jgi:hypothetical protein
MNDEGFVERCWFIYGIRLGNIYLGFLKYHSRGTENGVDYQDWKSALNFFHIGWFHTHPGVGFLTPSQIDNRTMRSWVRARNRPLLCGIFCGKDKALYEYSRSKDWSKNRNKSIYRNFLVNFVFCGFVIGCKSLNVTGIEL